MRKRAMDKLAAEIAVLDEQRRVRQSFVDEDRLTEAERAFCVLADTRHERHGRERSPRALRSGSGEDPDQEGRG